MNYLDSNLDCNTCANPSPQNKECNVLKGLDASWGGGGGFKPLFFRLIVYNGLLTQL